MEESTGDRGIWPLPEDFVDGAKEEGSWAQVETKMLGLPWLPSG